MTAEESVQKESPSLDGARYPHTAKFESLLESDSDTDSESEFLELSEIAELASAAGAAPGPGRDLWESLTANKVKLEARTRRAAAEHRAKKQAPQ